MQVPDLFDGHDQDDNIRQDIRHRIADKGTPQIDTLSSDPRCPRLGNGITLEDAYHGDGEPPRHNRPADTIRSDFEFAAGEDAQVHGQDRDLDEGDGGDVHAFEGEEELEDDL